MEESPEAHSPSGATVAARLRRSSQACQRCRRRKQKCDLRYPKCSTCVASHAPCLTYDVEKQSEIPRGYISSLEGQVAALESEVEELRKWKSLVAMHGSPTRTTAPDVDGSSGAVGSNNNTGPETVDTATSDPQEMVKSMGLVLLESSNQPRFMGTSSGITFAKMVLAAINKDVASEQATSSRFNGAIDRELMPSSGYTVSSLPPRHAAEHIAAVYFSFRTPHTPILQRSRVKGAMDRVYSALESSGSHLDGVAELDCFIVYMMLAVGLCGMPVVGGLRPPQSDGCFNSALRSVDKLLVCSASNLETLTVVLLLAQYVTLNPSKGSLWQLAGMALRLCVDLGLHWETEAVLSMSQEVLNERRRLFWATYRLDRFLCITLGRPFGIAEQSMNASLPDPYFGSATGTRDSYYQRCANHMFRLYSLQSEIKHVLYHQLQGFTALAYPKANYTPWFRDIVSRLCSWRDEVPACTFNGANEREESIYAQKSWWDAHHCNAILLLHRPNPLVPVPQTESLRTCFDAARRSIQAIKTLQREGQIGTTWVWVHHLFLAGLTMIYCIWQSPDIRNSAAVVDVMTATHDCASTLAALTERFAGAAGCRDSFEGLSSTTLKWLVTRDHGNSAGGQAAQPNLGSEMDAIRCLLPLPNSSGLGPSGSEPAAIFSEEPFEFAHFLSMAAQSQEQNGVGDLLGLF